MIHYKIDASPAVTVGICHEPGCGARTLASSREEAIQQRTDHEERAHMRRGRLATRRAPNRTK